MWCNIIPNPPRAIGELLLNQLSSIFEEAKKYPDNPQQRNTLQLYLSDVIQHQLDRRVYCLGTSPNGKYHILLADNLCLLISIDGFIILEKSSLFSEGELTVKNIQWDEKDNLVVFELFNIVYRESQKCICHFFGEVPFVYRTKMEKQNSDSIPFFPE